MNLRIRECREEAGYSREKFAELLGVSVPYLSELERGKTGCSIKTLMAICKILGVSADYLLFGEPRTDDEIMLSQLHQIDSRYLPLLNATLKELLALNKDN